MLISFRFLRPMAALLGCAGAASLTARHLGRHDGEPIRRLGTRREQGIESHDPTENHAVAIKEYDRLLEVRAVTHADVLRRVSRRLCGAHAAPLRA